VTVKQDDVKLSSMKGSISSS